MKPTLTKTGLLAVAASLLCNLTACGNISNPQSVSTITAHATNLNEGITPQSVSGKAPDDAFLTAQTAFALNLLAQTASANENGNLLLSPYSVMQALAMTANGANGDTLREMEQVLGTNIADLNEYLYTLRSAQQNTPDSKLLTANSIWFRDDKERIEVLPEFLQTNANYYAADAFAAPFDNSTLQAVNNWVSQRTDNMIPQLLNEIKPNEVMYLINAVTFDAKWSTKYAPEDIMERNFTCADHTAKKVQMMYSEEGWYYETEHLTGFKKDYLGGKFSFAALLPEEGLSPAELLQTMSAEELTALLQNPQSAHVQAGLPQFTFDYNTELSNTLINMGMGSAFEGADFSRMAKLKDPNQTLQIGAVIHKTHIEVDADGTKAAAATAVVMTDGCEAIEDEIEYKYVILDRPFVCMILDNETNLPVFFGTVCEP